MSQQTRIPERVLSRGLWFGVAILLALGMAAVVGRAWSLSHPDSDLFYLHELLPAPEAHYVDEFNRWFANHPRLTLTHIVPGCLLFALAPFQFSSRIRTRYVWFHRWSGRVVALAALPIGLSGLLLGAVFPFGGPGASSAVFVSGVLFLAAVGQAVIAIRDRDVMRHREWMIRMFSIGLGISTVRIVGFLLFPIIPTSALELRIGLSFWLGFALTFAAGEFWLRHTRPRRLDAQLYAAQRIKN